MSKKLILTLPLLAALAGVAIWAGLALWDDDATTETLGGAELFADTVGDIFLRDVDIDREAISLDELNVEGATEVHAGPGETVYVEFGVLLQVNHDGAVMGERGIAGPPYAVTLDGDLAGPGADSSPTLVWLENDERHPIETDITPAVLAFTPDGELLAADRDEATISLFEQDGTETRLLGPPDDRDAVVVLEQSLEPISAIAALNDDRIAFVANAGDGNQIFVLEDGSIEKLRTETPVVLGGVRRGFPWRIRHLTVGPDNTLIAVGIRDTGQPVITLVDPDDGTTDVLAELEGVDVSAYVDPTFATDPPPNVAISTAAVGDDLVFLADGKLWRLEDAFGGK